MSARRISPVAVSRHDGLSSRGAQVPRAPRSEPVEVADELPTIEELDFSRALSRDRYERLLHLLFAPLAEDCGRERSEGRAPAVPSGSDATSSQGSSRSAADHAVA
jgi:hypothetical protein